MNIPVQNGQLPQGFCPADYQTLLNGFSAQQFVDIDTISGLSVSSTPPTDHTTAWLQLDSNGRPVRIYFFAQGAWLSLHPLLPGFTQLWLSALPETPDPGTLGLKTYDGGDGTATPASLSGPMWQLAKTALDGSGAQLLVATMPLGVGTLASGKAIAVRNTGGEENHTLLANELASHTHPLLRVPKSSSTNSVAVAGSTAEISSDLVNNTQPNTPADGAHNNMPPYTGVYFLQRTNRLFYVVNA